MPSVNPRYRVRYANGDVHEIQADSIGDVLEASLIIREREACTCRLDHEGPRNGIHHHECRMAPNASPKLKAGYVAIMFIQSIRQLHTHTINGMKCDRPAE